MKWNIAMVSIVLVIIGWFTWPLEAPIKWMDGDKVAPLELKPGQMLYVTRQFEAIRAEPVVMLRTLIRGDCRKNCDIVDLPSSTINLQIGEHRNQTREFVLPAGMDAGEWRVVFTAQWKDRLGQVQTVKLKELTFKVIE